MPAPAPVPLPTYLDEYATETLAGGYHEDDLPVIWEAWQAAKAGEMPYFPSLGPCAMEGLSWSPGCTVRDPAFCFLAHVGFACELRGKFGPCWFEGVGVVDRGAAVCEALWQIAVWWREWKETNG